MSDYLYTWPFAAAYIERHAQSRLSDSIALRSMQALQEWLDDEQSASDGVPGFLDIRELFLIDIACPRALINNVIHCALFP